MHAAFRDVHGARLHGFAQLVTLGDRRAAAEAASAALLAGLRHAHELRHPERAAAWLRAHVVRSLAHRRLAAPRDAAARERVLAALGARPLTCRALATLSLLERAAIVAEDVERLDPIDVETVIGKPPETSRRILRTARERYMRAFLELMDDALIPSGGELALRIERVTRRVLAPMPRP